MTPAVELQGQIDTRWQQLNSLMSVTYSTEHRYYISSLMPDKSAALLQAIRAHWQVENCLHWRLDVAFREDKSRLRDENAAANLFCCPCPLGYGSFV